MLYVFNVIYRKLNKHEYQSDPSAVSHIGTKTAGIGVGIYTKNSSVILCNIPLKPVSCRNDIHVGFSNVAAKVEPPWTWVNMEDTFSHTGINATGDEGPK